MKQKRYIEMAEAIPLTVFQAHVHEVVSQIPPECMDSAILTVTNSLAGFFATIEWKPPPRCAETKDMFG